MQILKDAKKFFLCFISTSCEGNEMGTESVTKARQKRKRELVYIMGGECVLCGYDKCMAALEFHHVDKTTKTRQLSGSIRYSWEKDVEEVKKCALVCSNCHKEIEAFGLTVETSFDEERYKEITALKENKKHLCKKCGKEIDNKSIYCHECWSVLNRKIERPTREELKQLIRNNSFNSIANMLGVADNTIRKWCKDYCLPHRAKDIKLISDKDWELI